MDVTVGRRARWSFAGFNKTNAFMNLDFGQFRRKKDKKMMIAGQDVVLMHFVL